MCHPSFVCVCVCVCGCVCMCVCVCENWKGYVVKYNYVN